MKYGAGLLVLTVIFATNAGAGEIKTIQGWSVETSKSRMDDSQTIIISTQSKEKVRTLFPGEKHVGLFIRCMEGQLAAYLHFPGHVMNDIGGGHYVTYRVDAQQVKKVPMDPSDNHEALGYWQTTTAKKFVNEIAMARLLVVRAKPSGSSAVEVEFALDGLSDALDPVRQACRKAWPNH